MKITDFSNLYIGFNEYEKFNVLICALNIDDAQKVANEYGIDAELQGEFRVSPYNGSNIRFDCDYVLT